MANITITDIPEEIKLSDEKMRYIKGGFFFYRPLPYNWLYRPVVSPRLNPFAAGLNYQWAARGQFFDQQHNNFLANF